MDSEIEQLRQRRDDLKRLAFDAVREHTRGLIIYYETRIDIFESIVHRGIEPLAGELKGQLADEKERLNELKGFFNNPEPLTIGDD